MRWALLSLTLVGAIMLASTGVVLAQQASNHLAPPGQSEEVCPEPVEPGKARCLSKVRTDANSTEVSPAAVSPIGYVPGDMQSAYNLPSSTAGSGMSVAIIDAFDNPNAESDLQTYRREFGLGDCTSTANGGNGCFKKVNQRGVDISAGHTGAPTPDQGWALEISLDLDMVSAICPRCNILLVETDDNRIQNLGVGVDLAASLGTNAISNSYGAPEFYGETLFEGHYNHPGHAITVSSGDSGYGVEFPAASQFVTAVGGTTLRKDNSSRGWSETVWSGAGSGCSAYISKPSWQTDSGCSRRTVADVAADADPNTGVAVYDSFGFQGERGWFQLGGTSASAPIIASVYALAGNPSSVNYPSSLPYSNTSSLYDVTSGSNGSCSASAAGTTASPAAGTTVSPAARGRHHRHHGRHRRGGRGGGGGSPLPPPSPPPGSYLCTGVPGYDGPTGNGTPNGTGAF